MEYSLEIERKKRFVIFIILLFLYILFTVFSNLFFGIKGLVLTVALLFFTIITPLLINRYKLFLFLWLFLFPFLSCFELYMTVKGINLPSLLLTAFSVPMAVIMFVQKSGELFKSLKFFPYLIFFFILIILNLFRPGSSMYETLQMARFYFMGIFICMLIYYFMINTNNENFIFKCIIPFFAANALVAIFQRITGIGLMNVGNVMRAPGLTYFPNHCGFIINLFLPVCLYMILKTKDEKQKWLLKVLYGINILALLSTLSKTSMIIYLTNLLIFLMFYGKVKEKIRNFTTIAFVAIFFMLAILFIDVDLISTIVKRFNTIDTLLYRFSLWEKIVQNMNFLTYLFGNGVNSAGKYLEQIDPTFEFINIHNGYLQLVYEYGIFGFAFVGYILSIFNKSLKFVLANINSDLKIYGLIPLFLCIVYLIVTAVDLTIMDRFSLYLFMVITTLFCVKMNNVEKDNNGLTVYDKKIK